MIVAARNEEVILPVAGEGGGYTILGHQYQSRWRFWRDAGSGDRWMLDDEEVNVASATNEPAPAPAAEPDIGYCDTLEEVLKQINACWPLLHPIQVHPSFASDILRRVTLYLADTNANSHSRVIPRWQEMCRAEEPGIVPLNLP